MTTIIDNIMLRPSGSSQSNLLVMPEYDLLQYRALEVDFILVDSLYYGHITC